jgi:hypothetical protein
MQSVPRITPALRSEMTRVLCPLGPAGSAIFSPVGSHSESDMAPLVTCDFVLARSGRLSRKVLRQSERGPLARLRAFVFSCIRI